MRLEFSSNVKKVNIKKTGFLEATLLSGKKVSIDLNNCLGNKNGSFDRNGKDFSYSSRNLSVRKKIDGSYFLEGVLTKEDGFITNIDEINLNNIVVVRNEELICRRKTSPRRRRISPRRKTSPRRKSRKQEPEIDFNCNIL